MAIETQRLQLPGLKGLRVAITAGGGGIGLAIARELKRLSSYNSITLLKC